MGAREVVIVFDSDEKFNPRVQDAKKRFAKLLAEHGWIPKTVELPDLLGRAKSGLDDFLVFHGGRKRNIERARKAFEALPITPLLIPDGTTAAALSMLKLPEQQWAVRGLLPVGLTILAGPPKVGKSFLILHAALAIATGRKVLGTWETKQSEVLYLALEDTQRRLQSRLRTVAGGMPMSDRLHLMTEWPRVEDEGLRALELWLDAHPDCRCVFVDTLARLRTAPTGRANLYAEDYAAVGAIKRIADARGIAIVLVHHLRKASDDDPLNTISGSTGITGAADALLILKRTRGGDEATLYGTGRDLEEFDYTLGWRGGIWEFKGETARVSLNAERQAVLELLARCPEPLSAARIATELGRGRRGTFGLVSRMMEDRLIEWQPGGKYSLRKGEERGRKYCGSGGS